MFPTISINKITMRRSVGWYIYPPEPIPPLSLLHGRRPRGDTAATCAMPQCIHRWGVGGLERYWELQLPAQAPAPARKQRSSTCLLMGAAGEGFRAWTRTTEAFKGRKQGGRGEHTVGRVAHFVRPRREQGATAPSHLQLAAPLLA
jgi:hypothetical protein